VYCIIVGIPMGTNCGPVIADFYTAINLNLWQNSKKTLKSTHLLV